MFERRCAFSTRKDKVYLRHILDAVSDIKRFMKGLTKEEFFENKEKQYAVLRALEIIGEATKNLSKELKAEHPEVQWSDIITKGCRGLQNRRISCFVMIICGYSDVSE